MKRLLYLHWLYTWDYRAVVEIIPGCKSLDMNRNKKCTDYFLWNNLRVSSVLQQFSEWIVEESDQERNLLRLDIIIVRFLILYWLTWRQQTGQNIPTFLIPQDGHTVVVDDRWFACDWRWLVEWFTSAGALLLSPDALVVFGNTSKVLDWTAMWFIDWQVWESLLVQSGPLVCRVVVSQEALDRLIFLIKFRQTRIYSIGLWA